MNLNNPDKPTFNETLSWLRENPEHLQNIVGFFEGGRNGALSQVINEQSSHHGDTKRMAIAGVYQTLVDVFSE